MTHNERDKLVNKLLSERQFDKAIEHAKLLPENWDKWQQFPSATETGLPSSAVNKILDTMSPEELKNSGFLYEMSHNLAGHHDTPTINRLANLSHTLNNGEDDTKKFVEHPSYSQTPEQANLGRAHDFWSGYERKVQPQQFAAVKSLYSGKPEVINHRGIDGHSSHEDVLGAIPHLRDYANAIQAKIIDDPDIRKRTYNGQPYIKVHRGIGGQYSKLIRQAAKYDEKTGQHDSKYMTIPTAPLSSWTTDKAMAEAFARGRGADLNLKGHGAVISKWMPVKDVLHSGNHSVLPGRVGAHPGENEIVFGHPTGRMKINTDEMHFESPDIGAKYGTGSDFNKGIKRDKLTKTIKDTAIKLGVATAMMGMPQTLADHHSDMEHHKMQGNISQNAITPLPGLKYIAMIESSGGKNLKHHKAKTGLNAGSKAIGKYGMMPMQILDTVSKDKGLSQKYPEFSNLDSIKDAATIEQKLLKNPDLETELANSHWKRLHDVFDGDENLMAHAWNHGIHGTKETPMDSILNHDYVKKYNRYKKLMDLENKPHTSFKKSEQHLPSEVEKIKYFESADSNSPQNQKTVQDINQMIENRSFHKIPNMGHFTHSSFIIGTDHENAWLMKVETGTRPGIKSAKYGLQAFKEVAFYRVARDVFGLGEMIPQAILGELIYTDDHKPAAAIRMLPKDFKLAVDVEKETPGAMTGILDKYRKSGVLHKAALLLYVLGDGDAHGKNLMTDGNIIKLIDHGSGFANEEFSPSKDKNIFIPYLLRVGRIKDSMSPEEKLKNMPKIDNLMVKKNLSAYILSINTNTLAEKLNSLDIDPKPSLDRLKKLQSMVSQGMEPDAAINELWVRG